MSSAVTAGPAKSVAVTIIGLLTMLSGGAFTAMGGSLVFAGTAMANDPAGAGLLEILGGMLGSFGVRMLAGYGPQDYARLVGVPPFLRSQKPRGRFLLYAGGELDWVQLVFGEPEELRAWVLDGRQGASDVGERVGPATSDVIAGLAAGAGYLGLSEAAFRKRRERSGTVPGEFRVGNQPAWKPADLDRWAGREAERVLS